jgi:hypothetical protein
MITFLRQRFPRLFRSIADNESEDAEQAQRSFQNALKMWNAFGETMQTIQAKALAALTSNPANLRFRTGKVLEASRLLGVFYTKLQQLVALQVQTEFFELPEHTRRSIDPDDFPLMTGPNYSVVSTFESTKNDKESAVEVVEFSTVHVRPSMSHGILSRFRLDQQIGDMVRSNNATVILHRPGGPPCLLNASTLPVSKMLHAEHPTAIFAEGLAATADDSILWYREVCERLGIEKISEMGADIEEVTLVTRNLTDLKRCDEFLVLPRSGAEKLGIHEKCRDLSVDEIRIIRRQIELPDDAVAIDMPDDGRSGGDAVTPDVPVEDESLV